MVAREPRLWNAASALLLGKRHLRRHLLLRHPIDADRVRHLLALSERRRNRRAGAG